MRIRVFVLSSVFTYVFVHLQVWFYTQLNSIIHGRSDKCTWIVCWCVHKCPHARACGTQLQCAKACNYLLMCQSIRQSCDPGCLWESPRRAWGAPALHSCWTFNSHWWYRRQWPHSQHRRTLGCPCPAILPLDQWGQQKQEGHHVLHFMVDLKYLCIHLLLSLLSWGALCFSTIRCSMISIFVSCWSYKILIQQINGPKRASCLIGDTLLRFPMK